VDEDNKKTGLRMMVGLLSEDELAVMIDVKPQTLQTWRVQKTGPDFVKLGKAVFYRRSDVEAWIASNVVVTKRAS